MGNHVGSFLRKARETAGLSQADLATALGLKSAQSISNIERGIAPLPRAMLPKLAELLKVNRSEFVDVLVDEARQKYEAVFEENPRGQELPRAPGKFKLTNEG